MSEVVVIEFSAPDAGEIYAKVNRALGWDGPAPSAGDWPAGMISHVAGASGDALVVVEAWESKAAQEQFMQSQLGPAFAKTGVPQPTRVEWLHQIGGGHRD
ncbi:MAG TPA: hypothetical protein VMU66_01850 [Gaiellales bacterium]|nr:hypothetical protein [Gaiellales bacterium]